MWQISYSLKYHDDSEYHITQTRVGIGVIGYSVAFIPVKFKIQYPHSNIILSTQETNTTNPDVPYIELIHLVHIFLYVVHMTMEEGKYVRIK